MPARRRCAAAVRAASAAAAGSMFASASDRYQQRASHHHVVVGLSGEPGAFTEIGDSFRAPLGHAEVDRAGHEQVGQLPGADVEGLAEDEGLDREPVGVGRAGEDLQCRQFVQGTDGVGVGFRAQHLDRGGEPFAGFRVAAPGA